MVIAPSKIISLLNGLTFALACDVLGAFLLKNDFDYRVGRMIFNRRMLWTQAEQNKFVAVHVIVLVKAFFFLGIIFLVKHRREISWRER